MGKSDGFLSVPDGDAVLGMGGILHSKQTRFRRLPDPLLPSAPGEHRPRQQSPAQGPAQIEAQQTSGQHEIEQSQAQAPTEQDTSKDSIRTDHLSDR